MGPGDALCHALHGRAGAVLLPPDRNTRFARMDDRAHSIWGVDSGRGQDRIIRRLQPDISTYIRL